jgi:Na+-translocating ferredoxin:NAD+ oxidoreductase RnfD subunit
MNPLARLGDVLGLSRIDKRYLAPILVTIVLIVGQVTFGFLESWSRTALAIGTSIAMELLLGRMLGGSWPHLASAYVSGISVGMLVRSPEFWPYALCSAISITSKYLSRVDGRHIWNPSNLGIVAMLVLAADTVASLSVQWGNTLLPMITVWLFGSVIIGTLGRFHIPLTFVASFVAFAALRAAITGHPFLAEVAPITGPMYQLFVFFMITDPRTVVKGRGRQMLVAVFIALTESSFRLMADRGVPMPIAFSADPALLALAIVGPLAKWLDLRRAPSPAPATARTPS